jgi:predicted TIM-barrel fold metal-dependent hydrolase
MPGLSKGMQMTERRENQGKTPQSLVGIPIIDVDTHLTEPPDLWTSRAPSKFKDRVPHVERATKGGITSTGLTASDYRWVVDGKELGQAGGGSVINKENIKIKGTAFRHWTASDISPAASFVEPRLSLMDEAGIWAQIVYPNVVGFGGQAFMQIHDQDLRMSCCTIWNDAMAEMLEESGGRIHGMAMLPWWNQAALVDEVVRVHELGLRGVNICADPQVDSTLPDLSHASWDPLWEACESLSLPINFHIGASQTQISWFGSAPWPSFSDNSKMAVGSSVLYLANARVIANLILSGILERFPSLKFVSVESGVGWIPFMLEALDYQIDENNVDHLSMKPSEYFRRQFFACFWFERSGLMNSLERVGWDNCMFETDFPHPTCLYPDPLIEIDSMLTGLTRDQRVKVLSTNAANLYHIDLPSD